MSNLNVYEAGRKKKKYKITKIVITAVTATVLLVTTLVGTYIYGEISKYNKFKEDYNNTHTSSPAVTTTYNPSATVTPSNTKPPLITITPTSNFEIDDLHNPTLAISTNNITGLKANLTSADYESFEQYIKSIVVKYPYEELYDIDAALDKYNQVVFDVNYAPNVFTNDAELSPSKLLDVVMQNNQNYLNDQKNKIGGTFYKQLNRSELYNICRIICDAFNDYSKAGTIDINKVKSYLTTLKIFTDPISEVAFTSYDDCLVINPNNVDALDLITQGMTKEQVYKKLIFHEIMHMFQKSSPEMEKANKYYFNSGIAYSWKDLKVNPLMFDWFVEASAEKNEADYTDGKTILYQDFVAHLDSLSLSTILNDNVQVNQTENLCFSNKLDKLFEQFDCKTNDEKKEVIKLLYAIDIMQVDRSDADDNDFFIRCKEVYGKEFTTDQINELSQTIKASECLTLTKQFYLNLAKQLKEKQIGLQDVFYLITVFENDLNSHIKYTKSERFQYDEPFLNEYIKVQDQFFDAIARSNDYTVDQLLDLYNNYGMTLQIDNTKYQNYNLSWMDSSKRDYILGREAYLKSIGVSNIRDSYEEMSNRVYGNATVR